jgi:hypothetical protein
MLSFFYCILQWIMFWFAQINYDYCYGAGKEVDGSHFGAKGEGTYINQN